MGKTKEISKEETILIAAEFEFLDKGFDKVTMRGIAEKANVNQALLHYYYRSKEALFNKVLDNKIIIISESFIQIFEKKYSFLEKLEKAIEFHFDFLCKNPELALFIIRDIINNQERLDKIKKLFLPIMLPLLQKLQKEIDEAAKRKEITKIDAPNLILEIISINVFPFLLLPALEITGKKNLQQFLNKKKRENVILILKRLER